MTFGEAIDALKEGERIRRKSWPQDKFLWLKEAMMIKESWCKDPQLKDIVKRYGESSIIIGGEKTIFGWPTISIYEKGTVMSGWCANCQDILAEDWAVF
jgi:hypothetical protein